MTPQKDDEELKQREEFTDFNNEKAVSTASILVSETLFQLATGIFDTQVIYNIYKYINQCVEKSLKNDSSVIITYAQVILKGVKKDALIDAFHDHLISVLANPIYGLIIDYPNNKSKKELIDTTLREIEITVLSDEFTTSFINALSQILIKQIIFNNIEIDTGLFINLLSKEIENTTIIPDIGSIIIEILRPKLTNRFLDKITEEFEKTDDSLPLNGDINQEYSNTLSQSIKAFEEIISTLEKEINEKVEKKFDKFNSKIEAQKEKLQKIEAKILVQIITIMSFFFTFFVTIDISKGIFSVDPVKIIPNYPYLGFPIIILSFITMIIIFGSLQYCFIKKLIINNSNQFKKKAKKTDPPKPIKS